MAYITPNANTADTAAWVTVATLGIGTTAA